MSMVIHGWYSIVSCYTRNSSLEKCNKIMKSNNDVYLKQEGSKIPSSIRMLWKGFADNI